MLTLGFVKVTRGYVKKAHMKSEIKMLFSCFLKNLLLSSQDDLYNLLFVIWHYLHDTDSFEFASQSWLPN